MLRGSSRHDGIPIKQSAKERDRDRQREQQRKERAQMLPDDKEIHATTQDLFHAPVKVKPSVEDTTSQQVRNSLGSFESIRHLMIDADSSRRLTCLVGVDQGALPGTPVAAHRNSSHSVPPQYRPSLSSNSSGLNSLNSEPVGTSHLAPNSTKSHYSRNLFTANLHSGSGISNSATLSATSNSSGSGSSLPTTTISFRVSSTQNHPLNPAQKVPHSQNQNLQTQLPPHSSVFNHNVNVNSNTAASVHVPNPSVPNSGPGPILSTRSPNISNNQQVRSKHNHNLANANTTSVSDTNLDGTSGSSSDKFSVIANNEPNFSNCSNSIRNDKSSKASFPNKKPALERADSQLELESILKEMTDITPPLSAIQTPAKEVSVSKKLSQRRSSKSEDKIVQSIINSGMAKVPSPIEKMESSAESSSSYETDSDSESEDSSSGSHPGGDKLDNSSLNSSAPANTGSPTTKWNLSSFLKSTDQSSTKLGNNKSPKDIKPYGETDSFLDDLANPEKIDNVSSTVSNKSQSASPLDTTPPTNMGLSTRAKVASRTRAATELRSAESNIPPKQLPPSIPSKGSSTLTNNKISSLSSSSEDEEETITKPKQKPAAKASQVEDKKAATGATNSRNKRPRTSAGQSTSASNSARNSANANNKSDGESSPEAANKNSKNGQDKNKNDTIRKLFRLGTNKPNSKVQSPSLDETSSNSKPNHGSTQASSKQNQSTNRVSGKGNPATVSVSHNGDLIAGASFSDKKKDSKEKGSSQAQSRKHQKTANANSHNKSLTSPETGPVVPCPPPVRIKEESAKSSSSTSSLMIRIPLDKLRRKPALTFIPSASIISPSATKNEKELEKAGKGAASTSIVNLDPFRLKTSTSQNSSRVGSSSDPANTNPLFTSHELSVSRDDPMCSDSERLSNKTSSKKRPKKRSRSSPKKGKVPRDPPDSHTKIVKVEDDPAYGEVSSNVLGYAPCDSVSVTTTRTPPIDPDVVQAPDSSLNPPHLPSPFIPPQLTFYSYFEKIEPKDDLFSRDQESYLEEAKKLKHSADQERISTTQASMYLEAGLYFILTGIIMERDFNMGINGAVSGAAYTMYRDTLTLIQYIGNRWRSSRQEANIVEAKIITLSMRCQSLLSLKLFKMKLKETREMVHNMNDYFTKAPLRDTMVIASSPQLSTPSPHSPTSSPAGSSGVLHTPSPHHPNHPHQPHPQNHLLHTLPRALYTQIHKHCSNMFHVVTAHDIWEQADGYVIKYHLEDFFVGIDRQFGPLTLHSSLTDLVRYVRQGLQLINGS